MNEKDVTTCAPWCSAHDAETGQCVSAAHDAGRVSVWLVADPGGSARLAVDTPPTGGVLSLAEADVLAGAVARLVEMAGGQR
ncbi:MAG: hypothetical protein KBF43_16580 [Dermatophilaceae bacterium]|jgi:hypothetical protein|nr:hypothetical protein [Candidatus Phosphoribacter baldrii]MBP9920195.1 hypothetical protein [Dermatophilaceae bacterium]